jgi:hypothetical protein
MIYSDFRRLEYINQPISFLKKTNIISFYCLEFECDDNKIKDKVVSLQKNLNMYLERLNDGYDDRSNESKITKELNYLQE